LPKTVKIISIVKPKGIFAVGWRFILSKAGNKNRYSKNENK